MTPPAAGPWEAPAGGPVGPALSWPRDALWAAAHVGAQLATRAVIGRWLGFTPWVVILLVGALWGWALHTRHPHAPIARPLAAFVALSALFLAALLGLAFLGDAAAAGGIAGSFAVQQSMAIATATAGAAAVRPIARFFGDGVSPDP